ncbi:hypothetical protein D081_1529 [Anaerovibrio sp. JC8]|nr:hypothetical protein D081_1529 [Anaerovibrio sp. JC8]
MIGVTQERNRNTIFLCYFLCLPHDRAGIRINKYFHFIRSFAFGSYYIIITA